MKKRKLLMGALFCSIGIMGSTTVYAKDLTIDGISFEIPDEWQEVQNETKEDGSAYIKYSLPVVNHIITQFPMRTIQQL